MPHIEKRTTRAGQTRWRVQIRRQHHPTQSATFARKADAIEWAQRREVALTDAAHFPQRTAPHSLRALLDRYTETCLPEVSPHAQATKRGQLAWWSATLGDTLLAAVTPQLLAQARDMLTQEHAPATVNRYLSTLSACYILAIQEWGWCTTNPVSAVKKLREPRGRVRYLSDPERERLLAACQSSRNPDLYPLVVLALCTGARRGELLGLHWAHVDLARGMCVFHDTKNAERRSVPLAPLARAVLSERYYARDVTVPWVFPGSTPTQPLLNPRMTWERACKEAALVDVRWHDLRHTCASYLAMSGASILDIATILGHKRIQMTLRYSHLSENHTASVVDRMAEKFLREGKAVIPASRE